ncbi:MAG: TspO/MBR family protein [Flavobacteriaceae bacterium]|nr:TspO/MBR family protein [Flavobacteriaceae bacterium]
MIKSFFFFLIINFGALALGGYLMQNGPQTDWYQNLNIAPWTPPGWVFGFAWTTIMFCFSLFMAYLYTVDKSRFVIGLYIIQLVLNISWGYFFFNIHWLAFSFLVIFLLTLVTILFFWYSYRKLKWKSSLILPYIFWLCIACSLNLYTVLYN